MAESDSTSQGTDALPRNSVASVLLLVVAWGLYLASLGLPAIEMSDWSTGEPSGSIALGWQVVCVLLMPFLWPLSPMLFCYVLVNVCFWISPFMAPLRRFQGAAFFAYPMFLGMATLAAWLSYGTGSSVSYGYFAWALSLTTALIAFLLPLRRTSGEPDETRVSESGPDPFGGQVREA